MIRHFANVFFVMALLHSLTSTAAAPSCENIFANPAQIESAIESLARLRMALDSARAEGKNSVAISALESDYHEKENELFILTRSTGGADPNVLVERIRNEMARLQKIETSDETKKEHEKKEDQSKVIHERGMVGLRAVFHRIEPGTFAMELLGTKYPVTLTEPFEMMATPVTQTIWREIAKLHNIQYEKLPEDPSTFKGDTLPVTDITSRKMDNWIEVLNEMSKANVPGLDKIIEGHKPGDKYRLPTEAEWEFVARNRGRFKGAYPFDGDISLLNDHSWNLRNANGSPQPVGLKEPLNVDGALFYDMIGNVAQMTEDFIQDINRLPVRGGINPTNVAHFGSKIIRGGNYADSLNQLKLTEFYTIQAGHKDSKTGFRLVRVVRKP